MECLLIPLVFVLAMGLFVLLPEHKRNKPGYFERMYGNKKGQDDG